MTEKQGLLAFVISNNHWALPDAFFWSYLRMFKPNGSVVVKGESSVKASSINDGLYKAKQMGAEWFFLMDVDQLFPPMTIPRLMETAKSHGAGVVSVLYHVARAPYAPVAGWAKPESDGVAFINRNGLDWKEDYAPLGSGVVEVDFAGSGGMLIHRPVLDAVGWPPFQDVWDEKVGRRVLGHDINFCMKAKAKGFKIVVDTDVCSDHGKFTHFGREWVEAFHSSSMADGMVGSLQAQAQESGYWDVLYQQERLRNREHRRCHQETFMDVNRALGEKSSKIADVGCGPGTFFEFIKILRPSAEFTGYDFSGEAVESVKKKGFEGVLADIRNYSANGDRGKFDGVVSMHTIEHIKQEDKFLQLLKSLAKEGGRVVIATPWNEEIQGHFEHVRRYSEDSLGVSLSKYFKDVRITKNSRDFVAVCTA